MAIIKLGVAVVGIRGTIGGMTFSANKSGPYARAWSKSSNPRSTFQTAQRAALSAIPSLWRALTPVEQTAWDTFALLPAQDRTNPLGETFSASGFNWFTIINTRLINISRSTRTAPPVMSRPSAPTITSLVLPFLAQQATKITYPSMEFGSLFDQVIEIGVVISTGHTVAIANFLLLLLDQDPPDEDSEFVLPYLERWNLAGATLKGFARVYRQTTDGLRSSAGTASFVSTDTPAYAATAKDYDGTTNFALRGADLTSNANSKQITFSIWFRLDGSDGVNRAFALPSADQYQFLLDSGNTFRLILRNTATATILFVNSISTFTTSATWHNVVWSVDLATATVLLAVDGVLETPSVTQAPLDQLADLTHANHAIGAQVVGTAKFDGCISEIYINFAEFLDISIPSNLARFIDDEGFPVDLGETGAFPTGAQPIIYVRDADPSTNRGYGGNYVNQAALAACSTDPPT